MAKIKPLSVLLTGASIVGAFTVLSKAINNISHNIKLQVPLSSIKLKFNGLQSILVSFSLVCQNNYKITYRITDLNSSIFYRNTEGELVQLVSTPPTKLAYKLSAKATTKIEDITIAVDGFSVVQAVKSALTRPKGERFLLKITCNINNIPYSEDTWY
ncbi:MAG: hypothetical protein R3279_07490 [Putridiphycobacter sp.]|nr:hypothetical protein [Putridiphycobacter sp.]